MTLVSTFGFLILALCFSSNESKCRKNTVVFNNDLSLTHSILKVHCKSKDNDLGDHFLKFQDPSYNFSFHDDLIFTTKFKCNLWKGVNLEYHKNFTAYEGAPIYRCGGLFTWNIRDDAIYLLEKGKHEMLMYSWIKD
ncbi:unnamed protein product [Cochlearia groenlandica]